MPRGWRIAGSTSGQRPIWRRWSAGGSSCAKRPRRFISTGSGWGTARQTGIVACVSIAEYEAGRIRRHELTRPDKERERAYNIDTVGAQTGPVFLTYRGREAIDRLAARVMTGPPEYDFTAADGVAHTVWVIKEPAQIREVAEGFAPVDALYIADGHHRAAAAARVARLRQSRNPGAERGRGASSLFGRPVPPGPGPDHGLQPRRPGPERIVAGGVFAARRRAFSRLGRICGKIAGAGA